MTTRGLLSGAAAPVSEPDAIDDDALLAELGIAAETAENTELQHVRSSAEKRAAEEIANRQRCEDFEKFKPLFEQVQKELDAGIRSTRNFERKAEIRPGSLFIVGGQKAYVAEMGEVYSIQMIYMDPPYGIKYDFNFQPFINKREVKDYKSVSRYVVTRNSFLHKLPPR